MKFEKIPIKLQYYNINYGEMTKEISVSNCLLLLYKLDILKSSIDIFIDDNDDKKIYLNTIDEFGPIDPFLGTITLKEGFND